MITLYDILGVPWNADDGAIRAAFRSAAKTHHPDLNDGDPEAEARLKHVLAAYKTLRDPRQRAEYDRRLRWHRRRNARYFLRTAVAASALVVAAAAALTLWLVRPPRPLDALTPSPQGEAPVAQSATPPAGQIDVPDLAQGLAGGQKRGQEHGKAPDLDRVLADLDQAIRQSFSNAAAYNARGLVWLAKGQRDRAIADFTRAIEIDPRLAPAYANRATALRRKGDIAAAAADMERAAHLDPALAPAAEPRGFGEK
jgi:curved DNA-binding protein CbpA